MEEAVRDPFTHADSINGRRIKGSSSYGKWFWVVETHGPAFNGVHLQVWRQAGDTLEGAQRLAHDLGPITEIDESELGHSQI
jgi:hypothetical protein